MRRRMPVLLGLLGLGMVALALGLYLGRCNSFGLLPLAVTGYIAGAALLGGVLICRYRPGVVMSVLVLLGVAAISFLVGFLAFAASFGRCYEF